MKSQISYISRSSVHPQPTTPMDTEAPNSSHVIIFSDSALASHLPHLSSSSLPSLGLSLDIGRSPEVQLDFLCNTIGMTLNKGGHVLIPVLPSVVVFLLLDTIVSYLNGLGLIHIPIYFFSPQAEALLSYTNIIPEWLSKSRQDKAYVPEPPFAHSSHVKQGRIRHFNSCSSPNFSSLFRGPCVALAGHPSLRFGDGLELLKAWKGNPKNSLILIDTEYDAETTLAVHTPLQIQVHSIPMDFRLVSGSQELDRLVGQWKPTSLLLPHNQHLSCNFSGKSIVTGSILPYSQSSVISIPLQISYEGCLISPSAAATIHMMPIDNKSIATVSGLFLSLSNGMYYLDAKPSGGSLSELPKKVEKMDKKWGAPNLERIYNSLTHSFGPKNVVEILQNPSTPEMVTYNIPSLNVQIVFHPTKTTIKTHDPQIRKFLSNLILSDCY
eukprot:TRINITY_DN7385_c0_g2_i1.p1 TRINITY_DN7385_c0_g2~~TRINITY_DN7385_c0_g2_i1.p1  ORF type:complete len:439 (-),score=70.83 TRINITY_DN7385_c0_g2_i1:44-1360(-)